MALAIHPPVAEWQYLDITFGSASTDRIISHNLHPPNPEDVNYQVVRADRSTTIYHDQSGTRRYWKTGYIVLRSSAASAKVRLLLTVETIL